MTAVMRITVDFDGKSLGIKPETLSGWRLLSDVTTRIAPLPRVHCGGIQDVDGMELEARLFQALRALGTVWDAARSASELRQLAIDDDDLDVPGSGAASRWEL